MAVETELVLAVAVRVHGGDLPAVDRAKIDVAAAAVGGAVGEAD